MPSNTAYKNNATSITGNRNSTGTHKAGNQFINLSQSQRLNMSQYNQNMKNPTHAPPNLMNQSLKEYQEMAKIHGV
jgi:hypothetical protein